MPASSEASGFFLVFSCLLQISLLKDYLPTTALRHVLLSWKQMNRLDAPRKMIYLLDHQYSQANKTGSALKGLDAHKMAILQMLAGLTLIVH